MNPPFPHLAILAPLLLMAVVQDVRERRISNALVVGVAVLGLLSRLLVSGTAGAAGGLAGCAVVIALLWVPWATGRLGGGDLKLAAAAGAWLGLGSLPAFLLAAALAGGALSVICYLRSSAQARLAVRTNLLSMRLPGRSGAGAPAAGRVSVPYAAAISAGTAVALTLEMWK